MELHDFYYIYQQLRSDDAYLERKFLHDIFYPVFGDNGLDYLRYQVCIRDPKFNRNYYIDYVVEVNNKKYAIELDGYTYHANVSVDRFDKEEQRTNEITRQGYELIRYSYNQINNTPLEIRKELFYRLPIPYSANSSVSHPPSRQQSTNTINAVNNSSSNKNSNRYKNRSETPRSKIVFITILILIILIGYLNNNNKSTTSKPTRVISNTVRPTTVPRTPTSTPKNNVRGTTVTWHCVDVTSFDGNYHNDNKCTSSTGEVRYLNDRNAVALDPSYKPSKRGD